MQDPNWALARKRDTLAQRARIVQAIRAFFVDRQFLEVETPHRIPVNAPEPHIDALPSREWWLHTSPELAMKRLLAAGYDSIFQICRVWRDNERGTRHLSEFTMLEWYRVGCDYQTLMSDCEALVEKLVPSGKLTWQQSQIDLQTPWRRLRVVEAFEAYASLSMADALEQDRFEELLVSEVEPQLGMNPVFLYDYPIEHAALARPRKDNPQLAERFELYIGGVELANAFSELCDPNEQRARFVHDEAMRRGAGKAPNPLPEKFLEELAALEAATGIALGIDRLVMLLCDCDAIDEVVAFTTEML